MPVYSLKKYGVVFCLLFLLFSIPGRAQNWQQSGIDRVVAIADIHGAYESFISLLRQTGTVDDHLDWNGGSTNLVIIGDVLDRGPGSRHALDLIMKLETQAEESGGKVHMLLGNHEIMNLTGDLAYVSKEEFSSYIDDEDPGDRQAAMARFREGAGAADEELLNEFSKKYPPGYFGHRKLFAADGRYGQWLKGKPVLLKINNTLFVHGGLSKAILGSDGAGINTGYTGLLREYLDNWVILSDAGLLPPESDFYDHGKILSEYLKLNTGDVTNEVLANTARRQIELNDSQMFWPQSVIWYRGNVLCNEVMAESELDKALQQFKATRLVIGHTPTQNHMVLDRFNGKLVRADTGMLKSYYGGQPSAIIIEQENLSVLYSGMTALVEPDDQPRLTGWRPAMMSDDELETLLLEAPIREIIEQENNTRLLRLEYEGKTLEALFTPAVSKDRNRTFIPEVAAYRLDRLLGIDLVPAAVSRVVDGNPGALTLLQDSLVTEPERHENNLGANAWCPLNDQFNMMYIFDILAYNEGREPEEIRYHRNNWQLVLTGNHRLFSTHNSRPGYLIRAPVTLPQLLAKRLKELDEDNLSKDLGDVLDARRRKALLKRIDMLLESATENK